MNIQLSKTDITTLNVDAIVNAANGALTGGGGVDGAIHRAAGTELLEKCKTLKGCKVGFAKYTNAYKLPSKWIIHAVGPVWYGGFKDEEQLLRSCYAECFSIANKLNVKSIAFPAISCGAYKFPIEKACQFSLEETQKAFLNKQIQSVHFAYFDPKTFNMMDKCLKLYNVCRLPQKSDSSKIEFSDYN
jgi:O-acetyl-ADP-ribose deacetylase (regulator of RNase III)